MVTDDPRENNFWVWGQVAGDLINDGSQRMGVVAKECGENRKSRLCKLFQLTGEEGMTGWEHPHFISPQRNKRPRQR